MNPPQQPQIKISPWRWYQWPLIPLGFVFAMLAMLPLGLIALVSIPFFALYPERHMHIYDERGTPRQQELLTRWRTIRAKMSLPRRLIRLIQKRR